MTTPDPPTTDPWVGPSRADQGAPRVATAVATIPAPRTATDRGTVRVPAQPRSRGAATGRVEPDEGPRIRTVRIDDVAISSAYETEIVDHVMDSLDARRGGVIATPNVDIMRGFSRGTGSDVARDADLLVPDGMPLIWASRLQRQPLRARVTGADLFWSLSRAAAGRGRSVYLLGGAPGVGARAAEALKADTAGLHVAGASAPSYGFESDRDLMAEIEQELVDASPDIVFVALGFPKQEQVALHLQHVLPHAWFLGCGGAIDMAAGDKRRAPKAFQAVGLEWVHRMALEPGRLWRRYLLHDLPYVVGLLARSARRGAARRGPAPQPTRVAPPQQRRAESEVARS